MTEINLETLSEAIDDFNSWNGAARIYLNVGKGELFTKTYSEGMDMVLDVYKDYFTVVYAKDEADGLQSIRPKKAEYIRAISELLIEEYLTSEDVDLLGR